MKNPTRQELYDFLDGVLNEERQKEIEAFISQDPSVKKEISVIKQLQSVLMSDAMIEHPSARFTAQTMKAILPSKQESALFAVLKNSANVFAMAMVLALIVITYTMIPISTNTSSSSIINQSFTSYENIYTEGMNFISIRTKEYIQPLKSLTKNGSGSFFVIGIAVFLAFGLFDELIGKKYFR